MRNINYKHFFTVIASFIIISTINSHGQTPNQNSSHWHIINACDFSGTNTLDYIGFTNNQQMFREGYFWSHLFDQNCTETNNGIISAGPCSKAVTVPSQLWVDDVLFTQVAYSPGYPYTLESNENWTYISGFDSQNNPIVTQLGPGDVVYFDYLEGVIYQRTGNVGFAHFGFHTIDVKTVDVDWVHGAFWLQQSDENGKYGEIDIFESWTDYGVKGVLGRPYNSIGLHYSKENDYSSRAVWLYQEIPENLNDFNTYSAEWAPNYIIFYRNGRPIKYLSRESNAYKYIPVHKMDLMINLSLQAEDVPDPADLPVEWEWDNFASWGYSNIQPTNDFWIFTQTDLTSCGNIIPRSIQMTNVGGSILTSGNHQLRACDQVTLHSDITIEANGSGSFTILTPDLDVDPPSY